MLGEPTAIMRTRFSKDSQIIPREMLKLTCSESIYFLWFDFISLAHYCAMLKLSYSTELKYG